MPQALFYQPSYERLRDSIHAIAPALDVVLYEEDGRLTHKGKDVAIDDIAPEYFWIHADLFKSGRVGDYFRFMLDSPSIRWLHTINTGLDVLPYIDLLDKGVRISNNHGQAVAIAEFVIGQVLAHYQDHAGLREKQEQAVWKQRGFREISGSHWLIIGFGHIGQEISRRVKAFGATVTAVRRSQETSGLADRVVNLSQLPEVLPAADVVVLACTSNAQTRNLVDHNFLAGMMETAVLVNIARGDLVVEAELHVALDAGRPALAILDVFNTEPLPADAWFWKHPSVRVTPHSSNAGSGMRARSEQTFLDNLRCIMEGKPLLTEVEHKDIL
jgi:phosphoglycerate dehydrogenase-like enzyme